MFAVADCLLSICHQHKYLFICLFLIKIRFLITIAFHMFTDYYYCYYFIKVYLMLLNCVSISLWLAFGVSIFVLHVILLVFCSPFWMEPNIQTSLKIIIHLESEIRLVRDGITTLWNGSGCICFFLSFSWKPEKKRYFHKIIYAHDALLERRATSRVLHLNWCNLRYYFLMCRWNEMLRHTIALRSNR